MNGLGLLYIVLFFFSLFMFLCVYVYVYGPSWSDSNKNGMEWTVRVVPRMATRILEVKHPRANVVPFQVSCASFVLTYHSGMANMELW